MGSSARGSGFGLTPRPARTFDQVSNDRSVLGSPLSLRELESNPIRFRKSQHLIAPGERHHSPFIVHSGFVAVSRLNKAGDRTIIHLLIPGDIGNLRAVLLGDTEICCTALCDVSASWIPGEAYQELLASNAVEAFDLLRMNAIARSILAERLYSVGRRNGYQRVGHFLLEMHSRMQMLGLAAGDSFRAPLTLAVFGDLLALTPEHVSRLLQRLRRDGLISNERDRWNLHDIPRLTELCDFDPRYLHAPRAAA